MMVARKYVLISYVFYICSFFFVNSSIAQNVYIYGNLRKADSENLKTLTQLMVSKFKVKSVKLYHESILVYNYKKGDVNSEIGLEASLLSLVEKNEVIRHSKEEINRFKIQIISEKSNKKRKLIVVDKKASVTPGSVYNGFDQLINYLSEPDNKNSRFNIMLVLNKEKPIIKIKAPKENQLTSTAQFEGVALSSDSLTGVYVRSNSNEWNLATGTFNWASMMDLQPEKNTLEVFAVDFLNDTSEIARISNVSFKEPKVELPSVNYVYPSKFQNVVPKCINQGNYSYNFKLSMEPSIKLASISVVIENSRGLKIFESPLDQIASIREVKRNDLNEYCFFLVYTTLKTTDPCAIDRSENYYYYLRTTYDEKLNLPAGKMLIHFTSFSQKSGDVLPCNCD